MIDLVPPAVSDQFSPDRPQSIIVLDPIVGFRGFRGVFFMARHVPFQVAFLAELTPAQRTAVRPFSRMRPGVAAQMADLLEAFGAHVAPVAPFVRVRERVALQVALGGERLAARRAARVAFLHVHAPDVLRQRVVAEQQFAAHFAHVRRTRLARLVRVHVFVVAFQVAGRDELTVAQGARVAFVAHVRAHVRRQRGGRGEAQSAHVAHERARAAVRVAVQRQIAFVLERFVALLARERRLREVRSLNVAA